MLLKKINQMISDKLSAPLAEREHAVSHAEERLANQFSTVRSQQTNLQTYAASLDERAAELQAREQSLAAQERAQKARMQQAMRDLQQYKLGLLNLEYRVMDYAKRYDQKDSELYQSLYDSMAADVQKVRTFQQSHALELPQDGYQFETFVAELLQRNGFSEVQVTPKSKDFGADILAKKDAVVYVIQCKFYSSPVGIEAVQQVYGAKVHYGAHVPAVVTNNVFTQAAKILAEETHVLLWDCGILQQFIDAAK